MGIRCYECQKLAVPYTKYMHWLKLMNFIEFLFMEGYIEQGTYNEMQNSVMVFKEFASDEPEDTPVVEKKE